MNKLLRMMIYLVFACMLNVSPVMAVQGAAPEAPAPHYPSDILITEVQTGGAVAGDEFVELYNTTDTPVDLDGWQVRYRNAAATGETLLLATIAAAATAEPPMIPGHGYFVLHTASIVLQTGVMGQVYAAKLSSADKVVALFSPDEQTCMLAVADAFAWGTSADGEGLAAPVPQQSGERLVTRYRSASGYYMDTNRNSYDAVVGIAKTDVSKSPVATGATPGADNTALLPTDTESNNLEAGQGSPLASLDIAGCIVPPDDDDAGPLEQPTEDPPATINEQSADNNDTNDPMPAPRIPLRDIGLKAPQISELLPNPAKPLLDADDEFIELYNSNDAVFDLSGFELHAGLAANKKHFTFPAGTVIAPQSFMAVYAGSTHLTLSNSGGQVLLLDPLGRTISQSDSYGTAKDGQAWALAGGVWRWTVTPTPNAANVVTAPVAKARASSAKKGTNASAAVKGASTAGRAPLGASAQSAAAATVAQRTPLHTGVLALVGVFALLYGAYEYRSDVANKLHQFRLYREARREARQGAKGQ